MTAHASAADDHHHHAKPKPEDWPDEPLVGKASVAKVGMWMFLLSDALMFAGFLLAYGILRGGTLQPWIGEGEPELGINFTAALTFLLICSSVTMVLTHAAIVEKKRDEALKYLGLTILGGALFLVGQYYEYFGIGMPGLIEQGLVFGNSHYATTFYCVTSFHGAHVFSGVCLLSVMWVRVYQGKYDDGNYDHIEVTGLFWHFVDLVWILVFTLIYLIPPA